MLNKRMKRTDLFSASSGACWGCSTLEDEVEASATGSLVPWVSAIGCLLAVKTLEHQRLLSFYPVAVAMERSLCEVEVDMI